MELDDVNRAIGTDNPEAWGVIYPEAFRWLCGDVAKACNYKGTVLNFQEIAQDIFMKILLQNPRPHFASVGRFRAFLRVAAANASKDKKKKADLTERGTKVDKGDLESEKPDAEVDEMKSLIEENNMANIEEVDLEKEQPEIKSKVEMLVGLALKKLTPEEQSLVNERSIGVPYSTLAKELGVKEPNLKMRHKRALEKLKNHFLGIAREHNYEHESLRLLEPEQE